MLRGDAEQHLCECGCGTPVKNRYVRGHTLHPQPPGPRAETIKQNSSMEESVAEHAVTNPIIDGLIVTKPFKINVGNSLLSFKTGQIVTLPHLVDHLLKSGSPVEPNDGSRQVVLCPHCGRYHFAD